MKKVLLIILAVVIVAVIAWLAWSSRSRTPAPAVNPEPSAAAPEQPLIEDNANDINQDLEDINLEDETLQQELQDIDSNLNNL